MRRLMALVVVFAVVGCTPQTAYIEADRATYDVIAPAYMVYVHGDVALSSEQADRRQRLVDSWRIRLEQAEGVRR